LLSRVFPFYFTVKAAHGRGPCYPGAVFQLAMIQGRSGGIIYEETLLENRSVKYDGFSRMDERWNPCVIKRYKEEVY
jgi:hypothetical protein